MMIANIHRKPESKEDQCFFSGIHRIAGMAGLFLVLVWIFPVDLSAQNPDSTAIYDSSYFISLRHKLSLYTYGITKLNNVEFKNAQGKDILLYKPNEKLNIGLGFNYNWLGIGTAVNFHFLNDDSEIYGNSKSIDVQSDIYSRNMIFTANLQTYEGFYWGNVQLYDTTWNILDSVPLRPDIATLNVGASGFYIQNSDKFSFKSVYTNTEWQKRSAGSFLYGGHFSYYELNAESYLVPGILWDSYPTYDSLVNLSTFSLGLSMGYAYTYVFYDKFYLHATLLLGLGLQYAQGDDGAGDIVFSQSKFSGKSHFRLAFGVNNEDYYYGITLVTDNHPIKNDFQSSFIYRYGKVRFFYGQHLDYNPRKKKRR